MALTIYDQLEQGTPEWLEARRGIVTASTVGKLLTSTGKVANNDTSRALTETLVAERLSGQIDYTPPTSCKLAPLVPPNSSPHSYKKP